MSCMQGLQFWVGGRSVAFLNIHIYFCCSQECGNAVLLLTTTLPLTFHQHQVNRKRLTFCIFRANLSFKQMITTAKMTQQKD